MHIDNKQTHPLREDKHEHPHSHSHSHNHSHPHGHGDDEDIGASKKDFALLKYMLDHNKEHTDELKTAQEKFLAAGKTEAANCIAEAVHYFSHGNEELEKAVALLTEEV